MSPVFEKKTSLIHLTRCSSHLQSLWQKIASSKTSLPSISEDPLSAAHTALSEEPNLPATVAKTIAVAPDIATWLTQFRGTRFQVVEDSDPNTVCQVTAVNDGNANIRGRNGARSVPISTLRGALPTSVGETVRPIRGAYKGTLYRVRHYAELECSLHQVGADSRKADVKWATLDLVKVYLPDKSNPPRIYLDGVWKNLPR